MFTLFKNLIGQNNTVETVNTYLRQQNLYECSQVEYTSTCIFVILNGGVYNDVEIQGELSKLIPDLDIYIVLKDILQK